MGECGLARYSQNAYRLACQVAKDDPKQSGYRLDQNRHDAERSS
jgi:hypothetical protein